MYNFVANVRSGYGRGMKNLKAVVKYCTHNSIGFSVHITNCVGHARDIARVLSTETPNSPIIAVGGDGTFHEVLGGIVDPSVTPLGFIPSGRGNDYARAQGLSLNPIKAFQRILQGKIAFQDYIQVGDRRSLNVCGTGLDVYTLQHIPSSRSKLVYILSLVAALKRFDPYHLEVTIDGVVHAFHNCIVANVCNGTHYGGNIRISPMSKIDDGLLNIIVMKCPPQKQILGLLPKFKAGKHMELEYTEHFVGEHIIIKNIGDPSYPVELDGEIYDDLVLDCRVVAGGLKTFVE